MPAPGPQGSKNEPQRLTRDEFARMCEEYEVHPAVALEFVQIRKALETGDRKLVRQALENNL